MTFIAVVRIDNPPVNALDALVRMELARRLRVDAARRLRGRLLDVRHHDPWHTCFADTFPIRKTDYLALSTPEAEPPPNARSSASAGTPKAGGGLPAGALAAPARGTARGQPRGAAPASDSVY